MKDPVRPTPALSNANSDLTPPANTRAKYQHKLQFLAIVLQEPLCSLFS